ncbi:methyltransferase domain-containing protein [Paenibacillus sp. LMG 31461]|uniref:Methyltransferase domain-containing protein n=1 Tax=Paenibacillus plantarum TaxID=2654975 RepID=A0ABX1XCR0_9BACL|nr:methyltransferase domain-containing protein [Paenibacillus plantarum]NOU66243.1 methyltransferase domain-containing protein [Paenibacillus plantarum]
MNKLSKKEFWDSEWEHEKRNDYKSFVFGDFLSKLIPKGGSFVEIGCAPGSIMAYFYHKLNFDVTGVDYSSVSKIEENLKHYDVEKFQLYEADFTELKLDKKYTVVSSFGFVEHFYDYDSIIQKHMDLVEDKGYLVIELPNIRYFNWLIYRIVNPELLSIHNLKIMNLKELPRKIKESNEYEILYCNYYKSCFLFFNDQNSQLLSRPLLRLIFSKLKEILIKFRLDNISNRYFSPYIILVAKKMK